MSKLNIEQKTIKDLFQHKEADFLIPDYQRPYAWEEEECQTLWEDIINFSIPDEDYANFDNGSEYFLGPIVTFRNETRQLEVIDGQQRLTTLMLLLRAFYARLEPMTDEPSKRVKEDIEKCIWKTDEFGEPDKNKLKIASEVATDNDKEEFLSILQEGLAPQNLKSNYAKNFRFFTNKIDEFINEKPSYIPYPPVRILNNCITLPIEADSQDNALRIFSTLNDRGKPLSDSDIFKAQFYKFFSNLNQREYFIEEWRKLNELVNGIFHPKNTTPMDELFVRYMYFLRAKTGIRTSTIEALRSFYDKDNYEILRRVDTFDNLRILATFWQDITNQEEERFSIEILKCLFILNYAPNNMWTYITSTYFLQNRDENGRLNEKKFLDFLNRIIGFIWTYTIINPGVNYLRTPIFSEMINIVNDKPVTFKDYRFIEAEIRNKFSTFKFTNNKFITKSVLAWWIFQNNNQEIPLLQNEYQIEHIYPRNRISIEKTSIELLDKLGNKSLLERNINIKASDYRFIDKKEYYLGKRKGKKTNIQELIMLAETKNDYTMDDIESRSKKMIDHYINYLEENNLLK